MCKALAFPCDVHAITDNEFCYLQCHQWRFNYRRKYVFMTLYILMVVLIITDTFRENSTSLIDEIVAPLNEAQIPFSSTQGVSRS